MNFKQAPDAPEWPKGAQRDPTGTLGWPKGSQRGGQWESKVTPKEPKRATGHPKGNPGQPKGSPNRHLEVQVCIFIDFLK